MSYDPNMVDRQYILQLKYNELQALCKRYGVKGRRKKSELQNDLISIFENSVPYSETWVNSNEPNSDPVASETWVNSSEPKSYPVTSDTCVDSIEPNSYPMASATCVNSIESNGVLLASLEKDMTCGICQCLFIDAITLNCSHTFCRHCINQWTRPATINTSKCPYCRKLIIFYCTSKNINDFIQAATDSIGGELKSERSQSIKDRKRSHTRLNKSIDKVIQTNTNYLQRQQLSKSTRNNHQPYTDGSVNHSFYERPLVTNTSIQPFNYNSPSFHRVRAEVVHFQHGNNQDTSNSRFPLHFSSPFDLWMEMQLTTLLNH